MSEHDEQVAVIEWFELKWPKLAMCLMAYPSGAIIGGKNKFKIINKLKREGWRNGVSDLFLAIPKGGYHGLWLEMKDHDKTKRSVSKEQWDHLDLMKNQGYFASWAAGAEKAMSIIEEYMNYDS